MSLTLTERDPELAEILTILSEECAELSVECSKIIRFGVSGHSKDRLGGEASDIIALLVILYDRGILDIESLDHGVAAKLDKLRDWSSIKL